jgi:hypothetical protein
LECLGPVAHRGDPKPKRNRSGGFGVSPAAVILRRQQKDIDMSDFDNTNRGALFRNEDKDPNNDKDRDYNGSLNVNGEEFWLSAWVKTSKAGKKYMSLSVKPKVWKGDGEAKGEKKSITEDFDGDSIPF